MTAPLEAARFLIIDDHPLFREALHSAVQMAYPDVDTVEARSIAEAVDVLSSGKSFDLALLDLSMPDVRGFEGLLQLRTRYPRLPVVIVSGYEDAKIISEALSYGAAGFIPKSARKSELADAIRSVMDGAVFVLEVNSMPAWSGLQTVSETNIADAIAAGLLAFLAKRDEAARAPRLAMPAGS